MPDIGSVGNVWEPTQSTGSGGGGQRRSRQDEEKKEDERQAEPSASAPLLDREGRIREISEQLAHYQSQLIKDDLTDDERASIESEIQSAQIAMENLLSVSTDGFDPSKALDSLVSQLNQKALRPHPGAINRLLQDPDQK